MWGCLRRVFSRSSRPAGFKNLKAKKADKLAPRKRILNVKKRIDILVFEKGLSESREKARALIMEGIVFVNGERVDKPGQSVDENAQIEIRGKKLEYVSRGGLKLRGAIEHFGIDLNGVYAIDIGASTGGFTDCMLINGAKKVYAVDVGYGQLAWKLRTDPRVVNIERTNIRYFDDSVLERRLDFGTVDVSFIGLKLVLPVLYRTLREDGRAVCLIKPQFEAGREAVGKKGVVRDVRVHEQVIKKVLGEAQETGFTVLGVYHSPIRGPEGNIEYLMYLVKRPTEAPFEADIEKLVLESHKAFEAEKNA
ncbi:MAG: TlyA family RNA methyltransferase [Clostridia bacterium]|nr:TlyA family RNA methyltransferase [Clostridia bacterium]